MRTATQKGRAFALRLKELQLTENKKPNRPASTEERKRKPYIPLTEKDKQRISKEIEVLKSRI